MARQQQNRFRREKIKQQREAERAQRATSAISSSPASSRAASGSGKAGAPAWAASSKLKSSSHGSGINHMWQTNAEEPAAVLAIDADGFYDLGDEGIEDGDEEWAATFEADAVDLEDDDGDYGEHDEAIDATTHGEDGDVEDEAPLNASKTVYIQPAVQRTEGYDLGPYAGAVLPITDSPYKVGDAVLLPSPVSTGHKGKKRKRGEDKDRSGGGGGPAVLPVASLPDDWDGEVLDGATYLATVQ